MIRTSDLCLRSVRTDGGLALPAAFMLDGKHRGKVGPASPNKTGNKANGGA